MAENDYTGSLANSGISFSTLVTQTTVPGQNYYQVGLFVESVTDAPANIVGSYTVNVPILLTASTYSTLVKGNLLGWLNSFFTVNTTSSVYLVVYDGTTHDIASAHAAIQTSAYFKMVFFGSGGETIQYKNDVVSLAGQVASSKGLTQVIVGSSDTNLAILASGGSNVISDMILASGYDAMVAYSTTTAYNPMLTAIGLALSYSNPTGTPVGNDLDFNATQYLMPSTNVANTNISSTQVSNLVARKVGYFQTVGDGSGNVILNNRVSLLNQVITAKWIVNYTNFVCSLQAATMITTPGNYTFKNNATYQAILAMMNSVLSPFSSSLGRFSNFKITAPTFANLPASGGTVLSIPNAWSATYNDRVDTIVVNGSLTVTL